jgi:hypothetical protein
MKTIVKPIICALSFLIVARAQAQNVYSINVVGYVNLTLYTGNNLIADQLANSPDNTLDSLFPANSGLVAGTTFTEWNPSADAPLPLSVFNGTTWTINYTLGPNGIGGILNSPAPAYVTLVGNVVNVNLNAAPGSPGFYTFVPPNYGPGTYLLAAAAPLGNASFQLVVGRDPVAGESVETLDAASQTYSTTTFNGSTWDNGAPALNVDQPAFFNLEVPEPCSVALVSATGFAFTLRRRVRAGK